MTITELQHEAHKIAVENGWYEEPRPPLELLALIHSEVSECVEAWREPTDRMESVAEELADTIIRILDAAEYWGIDLEQAIHAKMEVNRSRGHRHGGKRF